MTYTVSNDEVFKKLLRYRNDAGDTKLENHLKNTSYIGKNTQNELIDLCGEEILQTVIERVSQSRWFSVIYYETTDAEHREKMSVSLRYVYEKAIREPSHFHLI